MGDAPLFVRGLDGTTRTIMVSLDITVAGLLTLVLDHSSGYLCHGHHVLNPDYNASDYGIQARDTLTAHMRLRGGPAVPDGTTTMQPATGLATTAEVCTGGEDAGHTPVPTIDKSDRARRRRARERGKSQSQEAYSPSERTSITAICPDQWATVQSAIHALANSQAHHLTLLRSCGSFKRKDAQLADWKIIGGQYRALIPLTSPCPVLNHKKSTCWLKAAVILLHPLATLYQNSRDELMNSCPSGSQPATARIKTCAVMLQMFDCLGAPRFLWNAVPAANKLLVKLLNIIKSDVAWSWFPHRTAEAIGLLETPQEPLRYSDLPYHQCLYLLPPIAFLCRIMTCSSHVCSSTSRLQQAGYHDVTAGLHVLLSVLTCSSLKQLVATSCVKPRVDKDCGNGTSGSLYLHVVIQPVIISFRIPFLPVPMSKQVCVPLHAHSLHYAVHFDQWNLTHVRTVFIIRTSVWT